eukprot:GILK01003425.1.p1 GENE.GILK01003425.1~~GILK01003425.1.p1  ORF type:complete len:305 (+),score=30.19 GILK01003425.1:58-915(+)
MAELTLSGIVPSNPGSYGPETTTDLRSENTHQLYTAPVNQQVHNEEREHKQELEYKQEHEYRQDEDQERAESVVLKCYKATAILTLANLFYVVGMVGLSPDATVSTNWLNSSFLENSSSWTSLDLNPNAVYHTIYFSSSYVQVLLLCWFLHKTTRQSLIAAFASCIVSLGWHVALIVLLQVDRMTGSNPDVGNYVPYYCEMVLACACLSLLIVMWVKWNASNSFDSSEEETKAIERIRFEEAEMLSQIRSPFPDVKVSAYERAGRPHVSRPGNRWAKSTVPRAQY